MIRQSTFNNILVVSLGALGLWLTANPLMVMVLLLMRDEPTLPEGSSEQQEEGEHEHDGSYRDSNAGFLS